jgi:hypothetical protein
MNELVTNCRECRPLANYLVALCGWHENFVAATAALNRIAKNTTRRDDK